MLIHLIQLLAHFLLLFSYSNMGSTDYKEEEISPSIGFICKIYR